MKQQAGELWSAALAAQQLGKTTRAKALFQKLVEQYPESFEAIDAMFLLAAGQRREPLRALTRLIRAPRSPRYG